MRVAYFSPLPPERSGIADYSALLLPRLSAQIDVRLARRWAGRALRPTDVALYHVGNEADAHGWIVDALHRRSGLVVLHEFVLHHLVAGMTLGKGDGGGYLRALEREAGSLGRLLAHGVIDGVVAPPWETDPERYPLAHSVLDAAGGLVVHSRYVEERARDAGFTGPIWRIPQPAWPVPADAPSERLGPGPVIGCFGHLNPSKRIVQLLDAFARLRATVPGALLVLAGTVSPRIGLEDRLRRLGLEAGRDVAVLDYVDEERLWALLRGCDVCVNLRSPTMGETSGMVIRILSAGKPVVVSDVGWFSELPDAVAAKIPVDEWEVETLAAVLELLSEDEDLRAQMGVASRELAVREHDLDRVTELYVAALEETAGGELVEVDVMRDVSRAAAEVGLRPDGQELGRIAERLREVGIGG